MKAGTQKIKQSKNKNKSHTKPTNQPKNPQQTFCTSFVMAQGYTEELKLITLLPPVLQYYVTCSILEPPLAYVIPF